MIDDYIICPLLALKPGPVTGPTICIGERCAWWSTRWGGCVTEGAAHELGNITDELESIGASLEKLADAE